MRVEELIKIRWLGQAALRVTFVSCSVAILCVIFFVVSFSNLFFLKKSCVLFGLREPPHASPYTLATRNKTDGCRRRRQRQQRGPEEATATTEEEEEGAVETEKLEKGYPSCTFKADVRDIAALHTPHPLQFDSKTPPCFLFVLFCFFVFFTGERYNPISVFLTLESVASYVCQIMLTSQY